MSEQEINKAQPPGEPFHQEHNLKGNDFYIGWMPTAPKGTAKYIKRVLWFIFPLMIFIGFVLSSSQNKFSTSNFEFGQLVQITGIYQQFPVPSLYVISNKDAFGKTSFITIPLVGYGKHGAEGVMKELEEEKQLSLNDKTITLKGTLLYSDGKTILQVDKNDNPLVSIEQGSQIITPNHLTKELGIIDIKGEILDPKCYFGVMKPGLGKPHRDCAIRCIAGGINPVFYVRNKDGGTDYCILLGANGEKINMQVQDFIADPVQLHARAIKYDDWIILYVDPSRDLKRISGASLIKNHEDIISCEALK
ncbi:MAG: hypothetical protein ABIN67_21040 [Ferruginibacter sp.]